MGVTYIILADKLPPLLERLITRLDSETATFLVHVDRKTDEATYRDMTERLAARPNVEFLVERITCVWGEFGRVAASLEGLRRFVSTRDPNDYVVLLSGQDYPLKTPEHIELFFRSHSGLSFLDHAPMPDFAWFRDGGMYLLEHGMVATGLPAVEVMMHLEELSDAGREAPVRRPPLPCGLKPFHGSSWWALSYDCAAYVTRFVADHGEVVRYFETVVIPDEMFFQTILLNSPHRESIQSDDLHYVDWNPPAGTPRPKVLNVEDYDRLLAANRLFARKFDPTSDEAILDMLDAHLGPPWSPRIAETGALSPVRAPGAGHRSSFRTFLSRLWR